MQKDHSPNWPSALRSLGGSLSRCFPPHLVLVPIANRHSIQPYSTSKRPTQAKAASAPLPPSISIQTLCSIARLVDAFSSFLLVVHPLHTSLASQSRDATSSLQIRLCGGSYARCGQASSELLYNEILILKRIS